MKDTILHPSDFYLSLAGTRAWVFFHKHLHTFGLLVMSAVALAMLQVVLSIAFPEMGVMWVSYFSFAMNTVLLVLFTLSVIGWAGLYFFKNVTIEFGGDKPQMLLEAGGISVAPDTLIMSLSPDESAESFKARMDAAFANASGQQWVLVIAFRHYSFSVLMTSDIGKEGVGYFLRTHPFQEMKPTFAETDASMKQYQRETFEQYVDYCQALADDFRVWAAHEKTERTNPFVGAAEWLKSQAVLPLIFLFAMLPSFASAQKTKQVEQYLGDRATLAVPEKGKEVSFVFERREISCISRGENYVETLKSVPFFQDVSDAGRLLLIKVGEQKILPKSPTKQRQETSEAAVPESALPIHEKVDDGGLFAGLKDSSYYEAQKVAYLKSIERDWRKMNPWLDLWMWKFYRILSAIVLVLAFLLCVAWGSSAEAMDDLHGESIVGDFIMKCYVGSKAGSAFIIYATSAVFVAEQVVICIYTGQVISWEFVFKVVCCCFAWYLIFKKILPNLKRNPVAKSGGYPVNNHRQLNG